MAAPNQTVLNAFVDGESMQGDGTPGNPVRIGNNISAQNVNATNVTGFVVNSITDTNVGQHLNVTNDANIGGALDVIGGLLARQGILLGSSPTDPFILKSAGSPDGLVIAGRGSLYIRTDVAQLWQNTDGGNTWVQLGAGGGGGGGLYAPVLSPIPTQASTGLATWWYGNSATVTDGTMGVLVKNGGPGWAARSVPAPAPPYTVKALVATGYYNAGQAPFIGWSDAASNGKADLFYWVVGQAAVAKAALLRLNNPTSVNQDSIGSFIFQQPHLWIRLRDTGAAVEWAISMTGDDDDFAVYATYLKAGSFLGAAGYSHILFGSSPSGGRATIMSWAVSSP